MILKSIRILIVLTVVALIVAGGVLLVWHKKQALDKAPIYGVQPTPVRVVAAHRGPLEEARQYVAVVEPIRVASVSARLTATVEKVLRDENEVVRARDILIVLDQRQIEESIATAKAQVAQAQADWASNQQPWNRW